MRHVWGKIPHHNGIANFSTDTTNMFELIAAMFNEIFPGEAAWECDHSTAIAQSDIWFVWRREFGEDTTATTCTSTLISTHFCGSRVTYAWVSTARTQLPQNKQSCGTVSCIPSAGLLLNQYKIAK